ncbi:ATP-dependent nuclease [Pseudoduganella rivuli]|nr:ATP-binding protein [Pseudoduganella rivuli]
MRLVSFSVDNYRSITKTENIPTSDFTVLIGQNNEGKSNLLSALVTAMKIIGLHAQGESDEGDISNERPYLWTRDFPLHLQKSKSKKLTEFRVEFLLIESEIEEFKSEIGVSLNGYLPISVTVDKDNEATFRVVKSGKNMASLEKKSAKIADFIGRRLAINYIPTIRTEEQSSQIIQRMLSREMAKLDDDKDYKKCIELINKKQAEILKNLSKNLTSSVNAFLPQVKSIEITSKPGAQSRAIRNVPTIFVDDGTRTNIRRKGDGIKSVIALSLFQQIDARDGMFTILAIEEPESHLHPGAIHSLRDILQNMSSEKQIFVTTHCPSLVNRDDIESNIIVRANRAQAAKKLSEIREVLGVVPADNLVNASLALLVEGADDKIILDAYFKKNSPVIQTAIRNGSLIIDPAGGASKIPYKASLVTSEICSVHVFLDGDAEGILARDKALEQGTVKIAQTNMVSIKGMPHAEFEDMLDVGSYINEFIDEYGIDLRRTEFKDTKKKWSDRVRSCFEAATKPWSDRIESKVKIFVAEIVAEKIENGIQVLHVHRGKPLIELVTALENRLKK